MNGLWSEIGKKIAEQWLSLLLLPGALYLAVAYAAWTLGHSHAIDVGLLIEQITVHAKNPTATSVGGQVVLLAAVLAGAAMVGLVAQAIGTVVERTVFAADWRTWPQPGRGLAGMVVAVRRKRWHSVRNRYRLEYRAALAPDPADRPDPVRRHRLARRLARIAVESPERPTWSGDRIHAAALRLDRDHHLDLATVWPHLWLSLPDAARDQISEARAQLTRATTLAGWAVVYLLLASWWWPALPLAALVSVAARRRTRVATDLYAHMLEAMTRQYTTTLATQLGIEHTGPVTPRLGRKITRCLQHSPPPE